MQFDLVSFVTFPSLLGKRSIFQLHLEKLRDVYDPSKNSQNGLGPSLVDEGQSFTAWSGASPQSIPDKYFYSTLYVSHRQTAISVSAFLSRESEKNNRMVGAWSTAVSEILLALWSRESCKRTGSPMRTENINPSCGIFTRAVRLNFFPQRILDSICEEKCKTILEIWEKFEISSVIDTNNIAKYSL